MNKTVEKLQLISLQLFFSQNANVLIKQSKIIRIQRKFHFEINSVNMRLRLNVKKYKRNYDCVKQFGLELTEHLIYLCLNEKRSLNYI